MKYIISLLKALSIAGIICLTSTSEAGAVCSAPTNLHITNLSSSSGILVWNYVSNATSYVVRFRPVGSTSWRRQNSGNNSELITGLIPNRNYEAKVRSNCDEDEGNYSPLIYFTTASNNACNLPNVYYFTSDNITSNSCLVGWRHVNGATSYNVHYRIRYSNSAWIDAGNSTTTSLQLNGLLPQTQYEFEVQTVCNSGTAPYSSYGIFTTLTSTCGAPNGLAASGITDSTASVSWTPLSCASYYNISYRQTGQNWSSDTSSSANFTLNNLLEGTSYEFHVQSIDTNYVTSGFSALYTFSTSSSSCGIANNLSATGITTGSATLTWESVQNAVSYSIRYRLAGAQVWQTATSTTNSKSISGLSADNAYEFQVQTTCSATTGSFSSLATFITQANPTSTIPVPDHIVICVMENKAYTQIVGSSLTPYINGLLNDQHTAVYTESYGVTHPSQPNYIHLFSGAGQGVTNNNPPSSHFNTPNLARELLNAGRTYKSYSEGLPSVGYDGATSGRYQRKHNPVSNWMGTGSNQVSSTLNQPFSSFPSNFASLPTVSIISPDMTNSMHDGTLGTAIANGDNWLESNLDAYIQWARTNNSLFILTWDEDDGNHSNRILTVLTGEMVNSGSYSQPINHYNILRTIEEMYGLNFIGASANEDAITGCWTNGFRLRNPETTVTAPAQDVSGWKVYPNPAYGEVHVNYELTEDAKVDVRIFSNTGSLIYENKLGTISKGRHVQDVPLETQKYPAGIYFMELNYGSKKYVQRFLISQ